MEKFSIQEMKVGLGKGFSGFTTILGNKITNDLPVYNINIGPLSDEQLSSYLPHGEMYKFVELLNSYFFPADYEKNIIQWASLQNNFVDLNNENLLLGMNFYTQLKLINKMEGQGMTVGQMKGQTIERGVNALNSAKIKPETKRRVPYSLMMMLLFALCGGIGYFVEMNPQRFFIISIIIFVLLGIVHLLLIDTFKLFDVEQENRFTKTFTYSLIVLFLGLITYTLALLFLVRVYLLGCFQ